MTTVNIHEAKTQLSRLVDQAASGKPFIIAKAGKPLVKVMALETPTGKQVRRLGFLEGQFRVPADFDTMGRTEIARMFGLPIRTLQMRRHLRLPPEFYRVGRSILYCIQEVEDFVRQGRAR